MTTGQARETRDEAGFDGTVWFASSRRVQWRRWHGGHGWDFMPVKLCTCSCLATVSSAHFTAPRTSISALVSVRCSSRNRCCCTRASLGLVSQDEYQRECTQRYIAGLSIVCGRSSGLLTGAPGTPPRPRPGHPFHQSCSLRRHSLRWRSPSAVSRQDPRQHSQPLRGKSEWPAPASRIRGSC